MKSYEELVTLFEDANRVLINDDLSLFESRVSERTLCGALMLHIHDKIADDPAYQGYYTDVEYNRNKGGKLKNIKKTIQGENETVVTINCDLILHSRGQHVQQDNLIAIEMKKSSQRPNAKNADRERLIALTKNSYDGIWSFDGHTLPEYVCRYVLGVYYEIKYSEREILLEYYRRGTLVESKTITY
ncbi:MAG: hypothetical protein IKT52_05270 [Oscillospiraceae bacterium]|nr:hypothetical protein [Oscillospiraceae bacterium]